ncbi:MAG: DUF1836 domain-containing protein [Hespellia sp.]|nr:DUF1836 domain-containing protein [Hespellia sp.]
MKIDMNDMLGSILDSLSKISYVKADEIPNIDLYMDQVTTFMDEQLASTKRYEEDKILTKTMINNYAKNNLIPPPVKKKYSKEHILVLLFVYYFKNILSIKDIEAVLKPLTDRYFNTDHAMKMSDVYREVCDLEQSEIESLQNDIKEKYAQSNATFADAPEEDREYLRLFAFICQLSFDIYVRQLLIEKIIDTFPDDSKNDENISKKGKK